MTAESPESRQIATGLAHRIEQGADGAQIADIIISILQEIDTVLYPIIGKRGVAALYKRSLYLTGPSHPWLAGNHEGIPMTMDLQDLKSIFGRQDSAAIVATGGAVLLQTFYELLISLVGPSLTERIFRSVWANSLSGPTASDTSP